MSHSLIPVLDMTIVQVEIPACCLKVIWEPRSQDSILLPRIEHVIDIRNNRKYFVPNLPPYGDVYTIRGHLATINVCKFSVERAFYA